MSPGHVAVMIYIRVHTTGIKMGKSMPSDAISGASRIVMRDVGVTGATASP
jgi:hypothetical protein